MRRVMRKTECPAIPIRPAGRDETHERSATALARSHESATDLAVRHGRGIFYTPAAVVDFIADQTLRPLLEGMPARQTRNLRILDPACGCGAFLLGAYRWLCRWYQNGSGVPLSSRQRRTIALRQLAGIDVDATAVDLARQDLAAACGLTADDLTASIRCGDALLDHDDWLLESFDAVVANPPYVNIRRLAKSYGSTQLDALRRRYTCASGAFDLYVLFLERSAAALRAGGRLGAIVPNKVATLDYARPCRELLLGGGTLDAVVDVSSLDIFADADVYPYVLLWTKQPVPRDHAISVIRPQSLADLTLNRGRQTSSHIACCSSSRVLQSEQSAERGWALAGDLPVESRAATLPLAEVCTIHSGATGFQAQELTGQLIDGDHARSKASPAAFPFIVSGNIDRYAIRLGNVRFMGRRLALPFLASDDPILTYRKRRLYAGGKIVLAGMSRHLEAALDTRGLALGVQVYALTDWKVDPHYLLAILNSSLMSHLFRLRFAAKRLAGGYFALSKRQLAQLPIRHLNLSDPVECQWHTQIVKLVRQRLLVASPSKADAAAAIDARLDELVLELYGVAARELAILPVAA